MAPTPMGPEDASDTLVDQRNPTTCRQLTEPPYEGSFSWRFDVRDEAVQSHDDRKSPNEEDTDRENEQSPHRDLSA